MQEQERSFFVEEAVARIEQLFRVPPGSFFLDSVRAKLGLQLQMIDRVSRPATSPVQFLEVVPGYDLFVTRNPDTPLAEDASLDVVNPAAVSSVDESSLALISCILNAHFARCAKEGSAETEEGGLVFESGDGMLYTLCRARDREGVLRSLGVSPGGVVRASDVLSEGRV